MIKKVIKSFMTSLDQFTRTSFSSIFVNIQPMTVMFIIYGRIRTSHTLLEIYLCQWHVLVENGTLVQKICPAPV